MANQWFKFYGGEYLSDPKIGRLSPAERSCWITLLSMASMSDEGIIKYLDTDDLLEKSGIRHNPYNEGDWEKCQNVLVKFSQMKMISVDDKESMIRVINWEKRQEHNLTVAERVAKSREKKKCNENVTIDVTNVTSEDNRIEENRIDIKNTYGESGLVKMTTEEYTKLIEAIGDTNTKLMIEELDDYLGTMTPKKAEMKYASHYKALRNWARRKYQIQKEKVDNQKTRKIV
jgi:hypothetical protein